MTLEQMQKTAVGIRNSCITKTGVKTELVDGLKTGQFPEDHELQCYTQCVMKTIRTFKNQKVDVDMVIKQVEMMMPVDMQDAMKASAKKCGALEPADDICVTAFNYVKCNYNENPDILKIFTELLDNASQKGEFPPDPKLQCYLKCIMTLSKAMRNDEFRPDVMKTQAELMLTEDLSERIKETIDKCFPSITSSDPCEAAWQFAKCYYETDSSVNVFY
ncbi:general odorant-binding protein 72-like [Polistes fuscatus]|uniref:general odorant-binding protein 72-like n=1 Tax=Polistes fuscatus TaxID=30207 RepID=UPI001CA7F3D8|nr:general odorant-binding protein 72-like [Polistes fuscatus]